MEKAAFTARIDPKSLDYLRFCAKTDGVSIGTEIEMLLRLRSVVNGNIVTGIEQDIGVIYDAIGFKH